MNCYTVEKTIYVPPKVPWGGGIGVETFSLKYLYEEYEYKNNFWTTSNAYKDLCRYLGCKFWLYRHPETDFIFSYDIQPPTHLNKYTYPGCHPQMMLLDKHKVVVLSQASLAKGKYKKKVKIKPPKQLITKWFFTKDFAKYNLLTIKATACNMRYSYLSNKNQNMLVNIMSLNTSFFKIPNWSNASQPTSGYYKPYHTVQIPLNYRKADKKTDAQINFNGRYEDLYYQSVNRKTGWFQPDFLQASAIETDKHIPTATKPMIISRYNPNNDNGKGNKVWVVSTLAADWSQESDKDFTITELPLWLALYGLISFIKQMKPPDYLKSHVICIKSTAIYCLPEIGSCDTYVPLDYDYIQGKLPYQQTMTDYQYKFWYPDIYWQMQTLNAIVESGPYIQKYSQETNSTWEFKYDYVFYFKWGGPHISDKEIKNPKDLDTYDVPDSIKPSIQILNPSKQAAESMLHSFDFRRGSITQKALKRVYENLSTDTEFQCSPEKMQKKERVGAALPNPYKKEEKIQTYLHCLSEKSICQESQTQDLQQLIFQQQEQQQRVKHSILKLLCHLKKRQRALQHHTGLLE